jgi:hypothetical protein
MEATAVVLFPIFEEISIITRPIHKMENIPRGTLQVSLEKLQWTNTFCKDSSCC